MINDKIVLVTGGTQGIGQTITEMLLQKGARVVVNSRSAEKVEGLLSRFTQYSQNLMGIAADVSEGNSVQHIISQVMNKWGAIDILVNNAGIASFVPFLETTEADWDAMIRVNLKSAFLCTKAVLPTMIEQHSGHIIMLSSVSAKKPFPNCAAYGVSKAGLLTLANVVREEVRQLGIKVTAIIAGATNSTLWDGISGDFPRDRMMSTGSIAHSVLSAIENPDGAVEEILIRPIGGDL